MEPDKIKISISHDGMEAVMQVPSGSEPNLEELQEILKENGVVYGIKEETLKGLSQFHPENIEVVVASGNRQVDGRDGQIVFDLPLTMEVDLEEKKDFRDIINIPSVAKGDRIAVIESASLGEPGMDVFGEPVPPKQGKTPQLRAGKNTIYKRTEACFFSEIDGQLSFDERSVQVHPLYEVHGDLDLHTGNLDFIGSIVIRGNIPTGFIVKAGGDITVYGMVEAARLEAGGSIHISEGIAGMGKAVIKAGHHVRVGYINQAVVEAGQDLFIENSTLHSDCVAHQSVFCQKGNVIGGTTSAGNCVVAQSIGNRMHAPTGIFIGVNKKVEEKQQKFNDLLKQKTDEKEKLLKIGKVLERKSQSVGLSVKERITSLKQRNSLDNINSEITEIATRLQSLNSSIGEWEDAYIKVVNRIHAFTSIGFGKYNFRINKDHSDVHAVLEAGEIMVRPNKSSHPQNE